MRQFLNLLLRHGREVFELCSTPSVRPSIRMELVNIPTPQHPHAGAELLTQQARVAVVGAVRFVAIAAAQVVRPVRGVLADACYEAALGNTSVHVPLSAQNRARLTELAGVLRFGSANWKVIVANDAKARRNRKVPTDGSRKPN